MESINDQSETSKDPKNSQPSFVTTSLAHKSESGDVVGTAGKPVAQDTEHSFSGDIKLPHFGKQPLREEINVIITINSESELIKNVPL